MLLLKPAAQQPVIIIQRYYPLKEILPPGSTLFGRFPLAPNNSPRRPSPWPPSPRVSYLQNIGASCILFRNESSATTHHPSAVLGWLVLKLVGADKRLLINVQRLQSSGTHLNIAHPGSTDNVSTSTGQQDRIMIRSQEDIRFIPFPGIEIMAHPSCLETHRVRWHHYRTATPMHTE